MGGSLEYKEICEAIRGEENYQNIKTFVETGTYKGDTTLMASQHYDHVYTMEIVDTHYNASKLRAENENRHNITFLLGDSVQLLKQILPHIQHSAIFFIDAHQSGLDTDNNGKNVPLIDELRVILSTKQAPSLFIFDDVRFWVNHENAAWDWVDVSEQSILREFKRYNYVIDKFYVKNDRFFVLAHS